VVRDEPGGTVNRLRANDTCWCGSRTKFKRCHGDHERFRRKPVQPGHVGPVRSVPASIARPPYVGDRVRGPRRPQVFDADGIDRMRAAGRVAAEVLLTTGRAVRPGVTTDELDRIAHETYVALGSYPSTLGYGTYTKSICTSVNEVVCHGIPDDRPLEEGDIVNLDVTAYVDGVHGDTSATFAVGPIDEPTDALVRTTCEATLRGIAAVAPGRELRAIGRAIEAYALPRGYGVVRDYGGHGIGEVFHADPHIHHVEVREDTMRFVPGMCFTVEPMLTAGTHRHEDWDDGWTVVTEDRLPSAQFEHTIAVTEDGIEVLTVTADGGSAVRWPNA
jgi:methionyl aminopeptidase